ncbi:MAG TPA: flagellar assembly protein FliW [Paludibaculum sp.]
MPSIHTAEFGQLTYEESQVFVFPDGLHGFEGSKEFLLIQREGLAPFCFLQSLAEGALRFICLPARVIDPAYAAAVDTEDAGELQIPAGNYAAVRPDVVVLAILTIPDEGPATANLFAPVLLATATRRGRQCIQFGSSAPAAHAVPWMVA